MVTAFWMYLYLLAVQALANFQPGGSNYAPGPPPQNQCQSVVTNPSPGFTCTAFGR